MRRILGSATRYCCGRRIAATLEPVSEPFRAALGVSATERQPAGRPTGCCFGEPGRPGEHPPPVRRELAWRKNYPPAEITKHGRTPTQVACPAGWVYQRPDSAMNIGQKPTRAVPAPGGGPVDRQRVRQRCRAGNLLGIYLFSTSEPIGPRCCLPVGTD
jgi:hypothetical protein